MSRKIVIDPELVTYPGVTLQPREIYIFDPDTKTFQKRWAICSEPISGADVPGTAVLPDGSSRWQLLVWNADGSTSTWQPDWGRWHG